MPTLPLNEAVATLKALLVYAEATSPDWEVASIPRYRELRRIVDNRGVEIARDMSEQEAAFIAAARNAMPALHSVLEELERYRCEEAKRDKGLSVHGKY